MNNEELMKQLVDAIFEKVNHQIEQKINNTNVEFSSMGIVTVVSESGTTAKVNLGYTTTDYIPNLSGSELVKGSVVKIFYDKTDMRNAYIGVRFTNKEAN